MPGIIHSTEAFFLFSMGDGSDASKHAG